MLAIETEHLNKRFGDRAVVDDVSLRVPMGCVYGFLGPNGAGKTTTMRLLLGLLTADGGRVTLIGHDLITARHLALAEVGAFVESAALYDHLTGWANLDLTRRLLGLPVREIDRVLDIVDMRCFARVKAGRCSLGMRQRLTLARAMLGSPRLLMLDEPTNGLDPDGIMDMRRLIGELPDRIGGTVFVSSHILAEVEHVAQYAGVMRDGRLVVQGEVGTMLDGDTTVAMTTVEADAAAMLLRERGMDAISSDGHTVSVRCPRSELPEQATAANRILVEADFPVSAVVPRKRSLEDVYREATTSGTARERLAA